MKHLPSPTPSAPAATPCPSLLRAYSGAHSFFFGSPGRTWLSRDARETLHAPVHGQALGLLVRERLAGPAHLKPALIAGAVPFDPHTSATLGVYMSARGSSAPPAADACGPEVFAPPRVRTVQARPARADYLAAVATLTERMRAGALDKAVLGRTLELACEACPPPEVLLRRLVAQNPGALCFAVRTCDAAGQPRHFLGASPELLVARAGRRFTAQPLAGSIPRSADTAEDVRRAAALLRSPKDRHEHAFVVRAVGDALAPLARRIELASGPELVATPDLWHLGTRIRGELADARTTAVDLLCALHPTPAVGGTPRTTAMAQVRALEGFDRGLFAGAVGYCEGNGDGQWAVSIRCIERSDTHLRLFAGAGVVAGSEPQREYAETGAKLRTGLRVLGLDVTPTWAPAGDGHRHA